MIQLRDINGQSVYVAASNVARISEASASSQWHGIKSIVRLFDGASIDCMQSAIDVATMVESEQRRLGPVSATQRDEAIDAKLKEYGHPANTRNAARAGWYACKQAYGLPAQYGEN